MERNLRKERVGIVVSDKMEKTVVVAIEEKAKLIKEYSQVMDAKRGTLLRILYRVENSAADELLAKLSEFE